MKISDTYDDIFLCKQHETTDSFSLQVFQRTKVHDMPS